ncbi:DUF4434 domain-containing protein [Nonomuraea sp. NPDC049269]|uniref:DUF4434 domain-containing protein n=1 Tax=Nonomuraea sp. NPDC049269 TaxID=3364349 RepID=UPI00370FF8E3
MVSGWILRLVAAVAVMAAAVVPLGRVEAVSGVAVEATTPTTTPDDAVCPARDMRVTTPYAITGYWLVPRSDPCVTRRTVEAIHGVGGDTLITFGPRLVPSRVDRAGRLLKDGVPDPDFTGCVENRKTCYQAAREAVPRIRRVYGYAANELFGAGLLRCPALDRRIESGGRVYYRLLLGKSCSSGPYDLVLIATDGDGLGNLMAEAAAYGMKVFPGLPAASQDVKRPWLPDLAHLGAVTALTERVLTDYRGRYGASAAFAGVYQSFELAVKSRPSVDPTIDLYQAQHAVVAATLPGKKILVSPYFDARRDKGFPPQRVEAGLLAIAATAHGAPMAVAVQDGRGTGKTPVYGLDEADAKVDPRLVPVVGDVTNRQAYYGSTYDYLQAAARSRPPGVELWVNVEAFEPTPVPGECGRADPMPLRGRTTKKRLDAQIMAAGTAVTKVISYGWDPFLTCQLNWMTPSLSDDLHASWNEPLILGATRNAAGIAVKGRDLAGGTVKVQYARTGAGVKTVTVTQGPDESTAAWIPFTAPTDVDPRRPWLYITAVNGAGHSTTNPYVIPA